MTSGNWLLTTISERPYRAAGVDSRHLHIAVGHFSERQAGIYAYDRLDRHYANRIMKILGLFL